MEFQRLRPRLVATTFRLLEDAPGADPTATALLDGLIELALRDRSPAAASEVPAERAEPATVPELVPA